MANYEQREVERLSGTGEGGLQWHFAFELDYMLLAAAAPQPAAAADAEREGSVLISILKVVLKCKFGLSQCTQRDPVTAPSHHRVHTI